MNATVGNCLRGGVSAVVAIVSCAVVAATGAAAHDDWETSVASSTLRLALDRQGRVTGLRTASGVDLVNGANPQRLFLLEATRTNAYTVTKSVDAGAAKSVQIAFVPGGANVAFLGFPADSPVESVVCRLRGTADDKRLRFGVEAWMRDGWALTRMDYPRLQIAPKIGEKAEDDAFASGQDQNFLMRNPSDPKYSQWFRAKFPTGAATQLMTFYDDRAGFVFAAEDAVGLTKEFSYNRSERGYQTYLSSFSYEPGVAVRPYDVTLVGLAGTSAKPLTWHDAADVYREWASRQKWCSTSAADRKDLPVWMKDAPAMTMFTPLWFDKPERIHRWISDYWMKKYAGVPLLASLWGWEGRGEWIGTDYFPCHPSDEAFVAITKDMRAHGIHPYPWPSGYFWTITYDKRPDGTIGFDDRPRFEKLGKGHVVCNRDGKVRFTKLGWIKGGDAVELCGGDPWTIPWVSETIVRGLAKRGCDVVQGDQLNGGEFADCWCRDHAHAPGSGPWKIRARRAQLVAAREAIAAEMPGGGVVTYEEPNETLDDLSGVQLVRYGGKFAEAERANLYGYVNHGAIPMFCAYPPRSLDVMAFSVTEGVMPRFVPSPSDCGGPVLPPDFFESVREVSTTGTNKFHYGENATGSDDVFQTNRTYRLSADFETVSFAKGAYLGLSWGLYGAKLKSMGGGNIAFPAQGTGVKRLSCDFTFKGYGGMFRVMINCHGDAHGKISNLRLEIVEPDGSVRPATYEGDSRYDGFMTRWIALYRGAGRDFLAHGRRVKPPRLTCAVQDETDSAPGRPAAYVGAFTTWKGDRKALVFANATKRPQRVTWFDGTEKTRELAPLEILFLPAD